VSEWLFHSCRTTEEIKGGEGGREEGKTYLAAKHPADVALEEVEGVVDGRKEGGREGGRKGGREGGKGNTYLATEHAGDVALEEVEGVVDGFLADHGPEPLLPLPGQVLRELRREGGREGEKEDELKTRRKEGREGGREGTDIPCRA